MKKVLTSTIVLIILTSAIFAQTNRRNHRSKPAPIAIDQVHTHDPVMAKEGDTYYLFSTGFGVSVMSSKDMRTWKFEKPIFEEAPVWATQLIPTYRGHTWAPDVIYHNGLWYVYYSCSAFGKNTSAIGVATNPTLNPDNPDYKWTDHGKVIQSVPNRDMWNAIDPNIIIDEKGTPWMNFGSFWDGIKMVRLTTDMKSIAQPEEWVSLCRRERTFNLDDTNPGNGAVEAPFIMKHKDYYYLFVSFDYCCRGKDSTYKVVVGRSKTVKGPYLDKEGNRMDKGGGSIVIEGTDGWAGIGHNSAYHFDGKDYFICHAYSLAEGGASKLFIREMQWDEEDWPIVNW